MLDIPDILSAEETGCVQFAGNLITGYVAAQADMNSRKRIHPANGRYGLLKRDQVQSLGRYGHVAGKVESMEGFCIR
jgi:hypothetical protein